MTAITINLFGTFELIVKERPITAFLTDKEQALLAFLALESIFPQRRESLGSLFWPDRPERIARQNLRQAIYQIRKVMEDKDELEAQLLVNAGTIQLNPHNHTRVDVTEFNSLMVSFRLQHAGGVALSPSCVQILNDAVSLFRGEFMAGFSLRDAPQFDLWQTIHREAYHLQMLNALNALTKHYLRHYDFTMVVSSAQRMLEVDPCQESAHRVLMCMLVMQGRRGEALHQYEICSAILRSEMCVEPSSRTSLLYCQIRDNLPINLQDDEVITNSAVT